MGRISAEREMKKFYLITVAMVMLQQSVFAQSSPPELAASFRRHIFPQKLVFSCPEPFGPPTADKTLTVGKLRASVDGGKGTAPSQIRISGDAGVDFTVPLRFAGCKVWTADLDKNGKQDLVIANLDAVNGPGVQVILVLVDGQDRPVPWRSLDAYFDFEDHGLENLVDLDSDGHAELLLPEVHGMNGEPARPGQPAIETMTRYAISARGLKRVDGPFAGSVFPIVSPQNAKVPIIEDWSTDVERAPSGVTIKSISPKCPTPMIRLDDPKDYECRITLSDNAVLLGRPDEMVIDAAGGRRIELQSVAKIDQMLEEARSKGYEIRVTCKSKDAMCRPLLMWASEKKNSK
jgi:hypothetical protein